MNKKAALALGRAAFFIAYLISLSVAGAVFSSIRLGLPGVARRPLTFFASPKKVSKERRPRRRCPFGVPVYAGQKMGSGRNSLRSDTPTSFSIFCPAQTASAQWNTKHSLFGVRHIPFFNKAVVFDVPHLALPRQAMVRRVQRRKHV